MAQEHTAQQSINKPKIQPFEKALSINQLTADHFGINNPYHTKGFRTTGNKFIINESENLKFNPDLFLNAQDHNPPAEKSRSPKKNTMERLSYNNKSDENIQGQNESPIKQRLGKTTLYNKTKNFRVSKDFDGRKHNTEYSSLYTSEEASHRHPGQYEHTLNNSSLVNTSQIQTGHQITHRCGFMNTHISGKHKILTKKNVSFFLKQKIIEAKELYYGWFEFFFRLFNKIFRFERFQFVKSELFQKIAKD